MAEFVRKKIDKSVLLVFAGELKNLIFVAPYLDLSYGLVESFKSPKIIIGEPLVSRNDKSYDIIAYGQRSYVFLIPVIIYAFLPRVIHKGHNTKICFFGCY